MVSLLWTTTCTCSPCPLPHDPRTDANRKRLSPEVFSVLLTAMHRKPDPEREEDAELLW